MRYSKFDRHRKTRALTFDWPCRFRARAPHGRELRFANVGRAYRAASPRLDLVTYYEIHNTIYCTFIGAARTRLCIFYCFAGGVGGHGGDGAGRACRAGSLAAASLNGHRDRVG